MLFKKLGVNISSSAELGIQHALLARKKELWLKENKEAIESSNKYVELNGLPLSQFRSPSLSLPHQNQS
ncbi:type II toxin-antitoxin system CcdA family antitoxin [Agaribacter flavus]|uniref:Type II toxin-antitoxin system CcdA family antitoxin n=1 Tax=Agaribacter flavus TaxID=1902781 RepID=A0ABV7FN47_9ALTE